jgi:hypothetical protein
LKADTGETWELAVRGKGNMLDLEVAEVAGVGHEPGDPIPTIILKDALPHCPISQTIQIQNKAHVSFSYEWRF